MILCVAAVREELGGLAGAPLGVGPVVAAARMARVLAEERPTGVVMLGTAGAYPDGPAVGVVVQAGRLGLADGAAAMALGYTPLPPRPVRADHRLLPGLEVPVHDVLTTGAVSTDMVLTERLGDGWDVEHLECFGAAWACGDAGVPFTAVLGIANRVGPDAHAEWLMWRGRAQDAARDVVRAALALRVGDPVG
jgi:purine-nucleoside phosphorylase